MIWRWRRRRVSEDAVAKALADGERVMRQLTLDLNAEAERNVQLHARNAALHSENVRLYSMTPFPPSD